MFGGDVADQLLDDDGLTDAGAAEQADLAALERRHQVDHLDPGLEELGLGLHLVKSGGPGESASVSLGFTAALPSIG